MPQKPVRIIKAHIRASDIAMRCGGDEFLTTMTDADSRSATIIPDRVMSEAEQCQLNTSR